MKIIFDNEEQKEKFINSYCPMIFGLDMHCGDGELKYELSNPSGDFCNDECWKKEVEISVEEI